MRGAAVLAGVLVLLAGCGQGDGAGTDRWTGDIVAIDCCATSRLPSPGGATTLVFEPDGAGRVRVILSAGWLRRQEIAVAAAPVLASWSPRSDGVFLSAGRPGDFRLFRTPDNGAATEVTGAPEAVASVYGAQPECAAAEPRLQGLAWSADGRRVLVLAAAPSCSPMVMEVAVEDGRVLEQYGADEAARRFPDLMLPGGVTAP